MPPKPRAVRGPFSDVTLKVAEMINVEVEARVGANATFEEQEEVASTIAAEVLSEYARLRARDPKVGG